MIDRVRRQDKDLALLCKVTVVALILAVAGCGGSNSSATRERTATVEATQKTETTPAIVGNDPLACLEKAGLSDVEERDVDSWRGDHDEPRYAITIHELAKPVKSPTVVAGTYALIGPFKVAAQGEGLSSAQGLDADALVQEVADCLGG